jgi:hypothetical protein
MSKEKIITPMIRLLSKEGKIVDAAGTFDGEFVKDSSGQDYVAGFDENGFIYCVLGDDAGNVLFEDGTLTGYNINNDYRSLVSMKIIRNDKAA